MKQEGDKETISFQPATSHKGKDSVGSIVVKVEQKSVELTEDSSSSDYPKFRERLNIQEDNNFEGKIVQLPLSLTWEKLSLPEKGKTNYWIWYTIISRYSPCMMRI